MKKSISKRTLAYPLPVYIASLYDEAGKPNMLAISWGGICCSEPPCIMISIRKSRHSYAGVIKNGAFVVNIPSEKYVEEADFTGIYSGKDVDKFSELGLTAIKSNLVNAPYIEEFPISIICKLKEQIEIGSHDIFVGEILDVLADESTLGTNGLPIIEKVKPFLYDSPGRAYYNVGEKIYTAYSTKRRQK